MTSTHGATSGSIPALGNACTVSGGVLSSDTDQSEQATGQTVRRQPLPSVVSRIECRDILCVISELEKYSTETTSV